MGYVRAALVASALAAGIVQSAEATAEPICFDAEVYATVVRQTPTVAGDCGPACIVISWPWILELKVRKSIAGNVPSGPLTVLSVQHTRFRRDLGVQRWWLRRNGLGAFNLLRGIDPTDIPQCAKGDPPAEPYIRPAAGQTLADLIRETEEHDREQR